MPAFTGGAPATPGSAAPTREASQVDLVADGRLEGAFKASRTL